MFLVSLCAQMCGFSLPFVCRNMRLTKSGWGRLVRRHTQRFNLLISRSSTADAVTPLLDNSPINFHNLFCGNVIERLRALKSIGSLIKISEHNLHQRRVLI